ncbi:hypothetical protein TNCV_1148751 [Trichonephila clavipes]|nr:hypothetical protein TNCV_1148751 [Trichonephila clavipes]
MAARLLHGRLLFTFQTLIKIEIFFQSRPLHRRSIHAEFKPLHRLNEVSKKWRSVSFTDAFVHCPDFGSKSKFYRSRPSPHNLWETTRGPRRLSYFTFILKLKQKLIKKVAILTDKFDDDMQKVTPARAPLSFSFSPLLKVLVLLSLVQKFPQFQFSLAAPAREDCVLLLAACHIYLDNNKLDLLWRIWVRERDHSLIPTNVGHVDEEMLPPGRGVSQRKKKFHNNPYGYLRLLSLVRLVGQAAVHRLSPGDPELFFGDIATVSTAMGLGSCLNCCDWNALDFAIDAYNLAFRVQ